MRLMAQRTGPRFHVAVLGDGRAVERPDRVLVWCLRCPWGRGGRAIHGEAGCGQNGATKPAN